MQPPSRLSSVAHPLASSMVFAAVSYETLVVALSTAMCSANATEDSDGNAASASTSFLFRLAFMARHTRAITASAAERTRNQSAASRLACESLARTPEESFGSMATREATGREGCSPASATGSIGVAAAKGVFSKTCSASCKREEGGRSLDGRSVERAFFSSFPLSLRAAGMPERTTSSLLNRWLTRAAPSGGSRKESTRSSPRRSTEAPGNARNAAPAESSAFGMRT